MIESSEIAPETPMRVLVVDDEAPIRELFGSALESSGFRVDCVENARKALQVLMQNSYDVLIVDMRMDEIDGDNFILHDRQIEDFSLTPENERRFELTGRMETMLRYEHYGGKCVAKNIKAT